MQNAEKILAAILVLAVAAVTIALPHIESGLPLHLDEYDNIAVVQAALEKKTLFPGDPFAPPPEKAPGYALRSGADFEFGYTAVLAIASLFGVINPLNLHSYFPLLAMLLAALSTFLLVKKICSKDYCAFLSSLFIFFLPSTQLLLGPAFLVASAFSLALIPAALYFLHDAITQGKNKWKAAALLLASLFTYPPSLIVILLSLFAFLAPTPGFISKNSRKIAIAAVAAAVIIVIYIMFLFSLAGVDIGALWSGHGFNFAFAIADYI